MLELRAADLRFTADEATAFLNDVMRLDLTPEMVELLKERTEGWIAGLQLAALSLAGRADKETSSVLSPAAIAIWSSICWKKW